MIKFCWTKACPLCGWYKSKANTISFNSMITTLEVIELVEDLISYLLKSLRLLTLKDWLAVAKCTYAKVKIEDLSNTLTLILSETAQRWSSSVVSNRSTALITNKFGVALLTKPAILNDANVALVDAVHYSIVIDALTITLIKDDDDLLGTVNSHIKLRRLGARRKTEAADSRYAKASRRRTKKDKDLENSNTSSDVLRLRRRDRAAACARLAERKQLEKEAQLKKTRDEEELAKAKKEKEEKEAQDDDYCLDSSLDINSEDDLEDEEAMTAKNLLTDAYILYFKELLSNNSRIFANAIGIGKTRAIVLAVLIGYLYSTKGKRTFYCACERSSSFNHRLALLAARFVIVCGFRKVDKHVFRAYNTMSVTAQRTIIRKGGSYIEKRAILLPGYVTVSNWFNATDKRDSVTSDCIYKMEDAVYQLIAETLSHRTYFLSTVQNAEQQCRDILEKEGLNELEASRRVIFNCFEMQAIAFYSALATLKAAQFKTYGSCKVKRFTLNSVKDLFTNLSKDYFLLGLREKFSDESVLVMQRGMTQHKINLKLIMVALIAFAEAIILTEATHVVIIEPQDRQNIQD
ncbi:hypothetical protein HBI39_204610 [Parastagonospora nodorum]|nr:hypothetical protein HBI39_204610 [Parastagonospora nodorum]